MLESGWRRLHNEKLYKTHASPNITRMIKSRGMRREEHVARMGQMRNAYSTLVGKPERKKPLGRRRSRWEDNIKMDLREIGWEGVDWLHVAQDRNQSQALMNTVINLVCIKGGENLD
jgi:hypothetical protein